MPENSSNVLDQAVRDGAKLADDAVRAIVRGADDAVKSLAGVGSKSENASRPESGHGACDDRKK